MGVGCLLLSVLIGSLFLTVVQYGLQSNDLTVWGPERVTSLVDEDVLESNNIKVSESLKSIKTISIRKPRKPKERPYFHGYPSKMYGLTRWGRTRVYAPFVSNHSGDISENGEESVLVVFPFIKIEKHEEVEYCEFEAAPRCKVKYVYGTSVSGVLLCSVPRSYVLTHSSDNGDFLMMNLTSKLTSDGRIPVKKVAVSTWPLLNAIAQKARFKVVVTTMIKDLECGTSSTEENYCLRDWLEWHLMNGVDHFAIYDNGSKPKAPHLEILRPYVEKGIVTLVDFPHQVRSRWGENERGQLIQLHHAVYAFGHRTKWLGLFDVDEFWIPKRSITEMNLTIDKSLPSIDSLLDDSHWTWTIRMHTMTHPDHCMNPVNASLLPGEVQRTTRLSLCSHLVVKETEANDHTKVFTQFYKYGNVPKLQTSPHKSDWQSKFPIESEPGYFVHFAKKYGCTLEPTSQCSEDTLFKEYPNPLVALEQRLMNTLADKP